MNHVIFYSIFECILYIDDSIKDLLLLLLLMVVGRTRRKKEKKTKRRKSLPARCWWPVWTNPITVTGHHCTFCPTTMNDSMRRSTPPPPCWSYPVFGQSSSSLFSHFATLHVLQLQVHLVLDVPVVGASLRSPRCAQGSLFRAAL